MAPPTDFADYPVPKKGPEAKYSSTPEHNPALRGIPLLIGANL